MIICNIIGGLGNQMFQYAAGRSLSLVRGQPLLLDTSGFTNYGLHQGFELKRVFDLPAEIATGAEMRSILGWQCSSGIKQVLARSGLAMLRRSSFIVEPHLHYWPGIKHVPWDCYLVGYWQSEQYFYHVASVIRSEFIFKSPLANRNAELAEHMGQVNAVALHVRRGDYVTNSKTYTRHGLCSLHYYRRAIDYISGQVEQPCFFIFSDDMAWVKANLKMAFPCQYIDHNRNAESYNDMHLMSLCRYHIIANSSFSWWGAWLNSKPDKLVVAPGKWFANKNNNKDLLPPGWVTL